MSFATFSGCWLDIVTDLTKILPSRFLVMVTYISQILPVVSAESSDLSLALKISAFKGSYD